MVYYKIIEEFYKKNGLLYEIVTDKEIWNQKRHLFSNIKAIYLLISTTIRTIKKGM